jgi:hypothetical protein
MLSVGMHFSSFLHNNPFELRRHQDVNSHTLAPHCVWCSAGVDDLTSYPKGSRPWQSQADCFTQASLKFYASNSVTRLYSISRVNLANSGFPGLEPQCFTTLFSNLPAGRGPWQDFPDLSAKFGVSSQSRVVISLFAVVDGLRCALCRMKDAMLHL